MHADHFADQLRIMGALEDGPATDRVLDAFRAVPREAFAGPGPWRFRTPLAGFTLPVQTTADSDPKWLYHAVLLVLDEEKGINIGDPGFWSRHFARADIQPGARILQVGAGVGYYTAILAELVGSEGHVLAYEVEPGLAERASANLADRPNVEVRHGNAATDLSQTQEFDLVVAFAGVTHVPERWSSRLAPGGRLLVPLTGDDWWGAMILASRADDGFDAVTLGDVGVYPCAGARTERLSSHVAELLAEPAHRTGWRFRIVGTGEEARLVPEAA
ncbi:MAG: methyltransferase domain-containing protein [Pseudomonadota bacterium]